MTELTVDVDVPARVPAAEPAVLVTEREVLLSSAAALSKPAVRLSRRRFDWRAIFPTRRRRPRPQRHRTRRPDFLEDALMARMMQRL
ncbi:MAG: hypothetical protein AB1925_23160 [Actinomycetota bacterium]